MPDPELPSHSDILASTDFLNPPEPFSNKVVKVAGRFAVKYGPRVSGVEAENLDYLSKHGIPVPRYHSHFVEPDANTTYLIMELVEGQTLDKLMPSLSTQELDNIFGQIWKCLEMLRNLPPPDYLGNIGRRPFNDGIFGGHEIVGLATSGPFANQIEMNAALVRRLTEVCVSSHTKLLKTIIDMTLRRHRTVFTHGDLQPKNIMVCKTGTSADGTGIFDVKIIDWEMSGWYPEYWEFCNATVWDHLHAKWLEEVQKSMKIYPHEYLLMREIRRLVFCLG